MALLFVLCRSEKEENENDPASESTPFMVTPSTSYASQGEDVPAGEWRRTPFYYAQIIVDYNHRRRW